MGCAVKDEDLVLCGRLQGLLDAAKLLNLDVGVKGRLQAPAPPVKTSGLPNIEVANFDLPPLGRELPRHQAGNGAFPNATFLRHHPNDDRHKASTKKEHACIFACQHASMQEQSCQARGYKHKNPGHPWLGASHRESA